MAPNFRLLALVAIIVMAGIGTAGAAYEQAAVRETTTNATVTVDFEAVYDLEVTAVTDFEATHDGATLNESTDYSLNATTGRLSFLDTSDTLATNDTVALTATGSAPAPLAATVLGPLSTSVVLVGAIVLVIAGATLLAAAADLTGRVS